MLIFIQDVEAVLERKLTEDELNFLAKKAAVPPVDLEKIAAIQQYRQQINKLNLAEVSVKDGQKTITISPEIAEEFSYTGLSNIDFFTSRFWEGYKS
jgi:glycerol-3-phosphate O-acyltransferase